MAKPRFTSKENYSKEESKSAYKSLARVYHPDNGGDSKLFIRLREAYEKSLQVIK